MTLTSLATSAFDTARSTFKGLAEAAIAADEPGAAKSPARPARAASATGPKTEGQTDATAERPGGGRFGTLLDAYA